MKLPIDKETWINNYRAVIGDECAASDLELGLAMYQALNNAYFQGMLEEHKKQVSLIREDLIENITCALDNPDEADQRLAYVIANGIVEAYNAGYSEAENKLRIP